MSKRSKDLTPLRWEFENDYPLSREAAFLIVRKIPGLSLDWLYFAGSMGCRWESLAASGSFRPNPALIAIGRDRKAHCLMSSSQYAPSAFVTECA